MPGTRPPPDAAAMINATEEFWDFERASYDDELDAWRDRTATAEPAAGGPVSGPSAMARTLAQPAPRRPAARSPRQRTGLRRQPRRVPTIALRAWIGPAPAISAERTPSHLTGPGRPSPRPAQVAIASRATPAEPGSDLRLRSSHGHSARKDPPARRRPSSRSAGNAVEHRAVALDAAAVGVTVGDDDPDRDAGGGSWARIQPRSIAIPNRVAAASCRRSRRARSRLRCRS